MRLSKTELGILEQIANGNEDIKDIAKIMNKNKCLIYRAKENLENYDFLDHYKGNLTPRKNVYTSLALQLLLKYPNLIDLLADSGLEILIKILKPNTIKDLINDTDLKKSIIYEKIKKGLDIGAIIHYKNGRFGINSDIWPILRDFLEEIKKYEETTDFRIPATSVIYYKNQREIIFSNTSKLRSTLTAFSKYEDYGIKLLLPTNFYYLPNKPLSIEEIFAHSIYIIKKETDFRYRTFLVLFYLKNRNNLLDIKDPLVKKIKKILKGEKVKGYPTFKEIKEKCKIYDIQI